jgi:hypothetical protein
VVTRSPVLGLHSADGMVLGVGEGRRVAKYIGLLQWLSCLCQIGTHWVTTIASPN